MDEKTKKYIEKMRRHGFSEEEIRAQLKVSHAGEESDADKKNPPASGRKEKKKKVRQGRIRLRREKLAKSASGGKKRRKKEKFPKIEKLAKNKKQRSTKKKVIELIIAVAVLAAIAFLVLLGTDANFKLGGFLDEFIAPKGGSQIAE